MVRSSLAVGKCYIFILVLGAVGILLYTLSSQTRTNPSSPLPKTTIQYVEDNKLSADSSATSHFPNVTITSPFISSTTPPTVCNSKCVPCSEKFASCQEVFATEPHTRPKYQYKRKVMLSTDIKNLFYTWFVPIASLLWYEKMGWQPVLLIVYLSEKEFTPQINLIIKYAIASGIELHKYKHTLDSSKYPIMTPITCVRFAACVFDWPEDTYVLTSDADMWPLSAEFFNKETSYDTAVHILYANGYGNPLSAKEYAVCYIGMKLSTWREVMKCHKGQDIMAVVAELMDFTGGDGWGVDQRGFRKRLANWSGFPNNVHFTTRNVHVDRIDRLYHKDNYVWMPHKVEAHVLRPAFTAENWPRIKAMLSHVLDQEQLEWIDGYAEHICSMLSCVNASVKDSYHEAYRG